MVLIQLTKSVLVPLVLTVAASGTDPAIQEKIYGSGTITLVSSNEDLNDIIKIVKSLEESGLLIKHFSETVEFEVKNKMKGFQVGCYIAC